MWSGVRGPTVPESAMQIRYDFLGFLPRVVFFEKLLDKWLWLITLRMRRPAISESMAKKSGEPRREYTMLMNRPSQEEAMRWLQPTGHAINV